MTGPRVRVALPYHLQVLAGVEDEAELALPAGARGTLGDVMDALEELYPTLRGTIRDHHTGARRAYMRFFAGRTDLSHDAPDTPLPESVARGEEVLRVVGAIAGG